MSSGLVPPLHQILLVAAGGTLGTAARAVVALIVPSAGGYPLGIFTVNVIGAFLLGAVVQYLSTLGPDEGQLKLVRLALGTGVIGGFTTYSTVAVDLAQLAVSAPQVAVLYFVSTIVAGAVASFAGIVIGGRMGRRTR